MTDNTNFTITKKQIFQCSQLYWSQCVVHHVAMPLCAVGGRSHRSVLILLLITTSAALLHVLALYATCKYD